MSLRHAQTRRHPREGGAAAVEFALVVPILVLLLGAILDFGFAFSQQIALNNAARDAARAGVVTDLMGNVKYCSDLLTNARSNLSGAVGIGDGTTVAVTVTAPVAANGCTAGAGSAVGGNTLKPCTNSTAGQSLQVSMTYISRPPMPIPFVSQMTLKSQGAFQCEYS